MDHLHSLAINDEGFVFDPSTGQSFSVNSTGLRILRALMAHQQPAHISRDFISDYGLTLEEAERDVSDFLDHLRIFKLL